MLAAIQIRFLGAKGMLTRDDSLEGEVVVVRDSMKKFEDFTNTNVTHVLYVLRCSGPKNAYTDRQIVSLLLNLGLNSDVLMT